MTLYQSLKIIHIISASVLFGTGIGTALYMFYANLLKDISLIVLATRRVVIADGLFTGTSGVLQLVTGLAMLHLQNYSLYNHWAIAVLSGYCIVALCWFIVVYLQIRCRDLATTALNTNGTLPKVYYRYFSAWVALGSLAFPILIVVLYLMANNPFYVI